MASTSSRVQQCSVAFACILLSLFTSSTSAIPIPWEAGDKNPIPWEADTTTPTETPRTVGGFHFKLSEDILVNATKDAVLKQFTFSDLGKNRELFSELSTGLDIYGGIFRPSTGYYFLSTLVHVAVVQAQEEAALVENSTNTAVEGEKEPRVTVSICIDDNCGNSA